MDSGDAKRPLPTYEMFEQLHKNQLELSGVPNHYWPTLFAKITHQIYDADSTFCMIKKGHDLSDCYDVADDQEEIVIYDWCAKVISPDGVQLNDKQQIYLIDHFLTFTSSNLDEVIATVKSSDVLQRMQKMVFPSFDEKDSGLDSSKDFNLNREHFWKLANFYKVQQRKEDGSGLETLIIWYVMDDFGTAIGHSDSPSFKVFPFFDLFAGKAYSVMFPLRSLGVGDEVTRDYLDGISDQQMRQYRKLCINFHPQLYRCMHPNKQLQLANHPIPGDCSHNSTIFDPEFFAKHRMNETLPKLDKLIDMPDLSSYEKKARKIKVFSDVSFVEKHLTDERFELVNNADEADIMWLYEHFKDYEGLSESRPNCYINQFPFENVLTVKDLLASLCVEAKCNWYPITFNLEHELDRFCNFIGKAIADGSVDDYYWIAKPWNLGRGMDIFVCNSKLDLIELIKRSQSLPYIVSRYVHKPLLFYRQELAASVKFDFRYLILLRSVQPLSASVYRTFWLRFANKEFNLDEQNLNDYATHFTVMNYRDDQQLKNIECEEFVKLFDAQYDGKFTWSQIEQQIVLPVLKETMQLAVQHEPPKAIAHSPQSRAIYAADLLLGWKGNSQQSISDLEACMCEVNYCPDLARACAFNDQFINHVFATLFMNEPTNCHELINDDIKFNV